MDNTQNAVYAVMQGLIPFDFTARSASRLMMIEVRKIRSALAHLRWRRRYVRWATAYVALSIIALCSLAGLFLLDVTFHLSVFQRVALFVVAIGCILWAARRYVLPFLGIRESEGSLALLVEREHGIDTDLVAALQFARPEAVTWGSQQLEQAVIERIAHRAPQIDFFRTVRYDTLSKRFKVLMLMLLAIVTVTAIFPAHVGIFFQRLALSTRPYPSDTTIETVAINGQIALQAASMERTLIPVKCAQGETVRFLVGAAGELPERGLVECYSKQTEDGRSLVLRKLTPLETEQFRAELTRLDDLDRLSSRSVVANRQWYVASLPQMLEEFHYSIQLGDNETQLGTVRMMALPIVEVEFQVTPPDYVGRSETPSATSRHVAVIEGSRVEFTVRSINEKQLKFVSVRLQHDGQKSELKLTNQDSAGRIWKLATAESPLQRVEQEIRYEVHVVDLDGLSLESPLQGVIQLTPDRLPSAVAETVHRVLLPNARPAIEFRVNDDYGIQAVRLQTQIERRSLGSDGGETKKETDIPFKPRPLVGASIHHQGRFELDLSPFQLVKGDQLKLTLEVTDYRGTTPGRSYFAEPLLLEVSDEAGVLAAITEADEESEKRLNDTIEKQLGVEPAP